MPTNACRFFMYAPAAEQSCAPKRVPVARGHARAFRPGPQTVFAAAALTQSAQVRNPAMTSLRSGVKKLR